MGLLIVLHASSSTTATVVERSSTTATVMERSRTTATVMESSSTTATVAESSSTTATVAESSSTIATLVASRSLSFEHVCIHDALRARAPPPTMVPQLSADSRRGRSLQDTGPPPALRIVFSTDSLLTDAHTCTSAGQVVDVGDLRGSTCTAASEDNCRCTAQFLADSLLPAVAEWFAAALAFRDGLTRGRTRSRSTRAAIAAMAARFPSRRRSARRALWAPTWWSWSRRGPSRPPRARSPSPAFARRTAGRPTTRARRARPILPGDPP